MAVRPINISGVRVSVVRPDLVPESSLDAEQAREANPRDPGELMRSLAGIDAVRRGPVGLDPSVRGLRETEVGAYVDGARTFPAGPARMDSQLGHIDPSAIRSIEVVKGPYALTWGAGNLSAIRIETQEVPPLIDGPFHAVLSGGYDANLAATETSGSVFGRANGISYWGFGAYRNGSDYESGDGTVVPADFESYEGRGKLGFEVGANGQLTVGGGYQKQSDVDYPGRLLNALFFETINGSADLRIRRDTGPLKSFQFMAYAGNVKHDMTNVGKPTSMDMPGRMPPFALDVGVSTESTTLGGRMAAEFESSSGVQAEVGADLYTVNRDAVRTVQRQSTGMTLFEDQVWPDVTIRDLGAFLRVSKRLGDRVRAAATGRMDFVSTDAGLASSFFTDNVSDDLDQSETNVSGAVTLAVDLDDHWTVSTGVGSAVRTADALERYSDRFPASKAQMAAEFVGNPALAPERSTQVDVWLEADYERVAFDFNGFIRSMSDYITLAPSALPKRLPLSPNQVFEYINGDATFRGFETSVSAALAVDVTARAGLDYLWGEDDTLDEPAIGIAPLTTSFLLRYDEPTDRFYVEGALRLVGEQDRVATQRGETATESYSVADLRAGVQLLPDVFLRGGVLNVFDEEYVNHLNSKNPFTGIQVPEPGRVLFFDLTVGLH